MVRRGRDGGLVLAPGRLAWWMLCTSPEKNFLSLFAIVQEEVGVYEGCLLGFRRRLCKFFLGSRIRYAEISLQREVSKMAEAFEQAPIDLCVVLNGPREAEVGFHRDLTAKPTPAAA